MRKLRLAVLATGAGLMALSAWGAFAQAPVPQDPQFTQAAVQALQAQRNGALDQAAAFQAQLTLAQQEITKLKEELAKKKEAPSGPDKPKDH